MDKVSPHPVYRAVCVVQGHTNWLHAPNYKKKKDLQARWDIVKRHRLCHVCMGPGHDRGRCESQKFCSCGSDKRYHRLLHNPPPPPPPRINIGDTNQSNQTREGEPKPVISQPIQGNVEQPRTTEPWSTVQYATVTEPTKRNTVLLHVILVKILSPD